MEYEPFEQREVERLQNLQDQILAMCRTGRVDLDRVRFCTAGRFTDVQIRETLSYLARVGILQVRE